MKLLIPVFAFALFLTTSALARENDPDYLPPPVLEPESSELPEMVPVPRKAGRSPASTSAPRVKLNGQVFRAKEHAKCPPGSHVADFHGWLCAKD